jgi:hypothetical protein
MMDNEKSEVTCPDVCQPAELSNGRVDVVMSTSNIPFVAALLIPAAGAFVSGVVRLALVENSKDRYGIWNIFAVGPDLMVAALIAIPALLAGRNAELNAIRKAKAVRPGTSSPAVNIDWNISGWVVIAIFCFIVVGVSCERLWAKSARQKGGFRKPFMTGILPPTICGLFALAAALVLGTP